MSAELFDLLLRCTLALTFSLTLVLALRLPWRRTFGARTAMVLWALVPLSLVTAALPAPIEWVVAAASTRPMAAAVATAQAPVVTLAESSVSTFDVLSALWLGGVFLSARVLWREQRRFSRHLGALRHWRDNIYFSSNTAHGPALLGPFRPRIVVPRDFSARYSIEQQALVLAHEAAHQQRGDLWVTLLACVLRVGFWFHPLVHLGSRCLRLDQELACDEAVIARSPRARRDYAAAILNTQLTDLGLPVGCFWQSSQPVKTRILMISKTNTQKPLMRGIGCALGLALAGVGLPLTWASQPADIRALAPPSPSPRSLATGSSAPPFVTPIARQGRDVNALQHAPIDPAHPARESVPVQTSSLSLGSALVSQTDRLELSLASLQSTSEIPPAGGIVSDWVPPKLVKSVDPKWPARSWSSRQRSKGGEVVVGATVDEHGRPVDLKIVRSSDRRFNAFARWAVEEFRFEPARNSGVAVSSYVELPVIWHPDTQPVYEVIDPVGPPKVKYPQRERYTTRTR